MSKAMYVAMLALIGAGFGLILGTGFIRAVGGPWVPWLLAVGFGLIVIAAVISALPYRPAANIYVVKVFDDTKGEWSLYVVEAASPDSARIMATERFPGLQTNVTLMDFHSSWRRYPAILIATDYEMYV